MDIIRKLGLESEAQVELAAEIFGAGAKPEEVR